ncbi:hypothetical protein TNCV_1901351, partial [Trichonephila clavipes]
SLGRDRRFGDNFAKELQSIPLSNDTVTRRNEDIAEDVEQQLFDTFHKEVREALTSKEMNPDDDRCHCKVENLPEAEKFQDGLFVMKLSYLVDVFEKLNTLNLQLQ